MLAVMVMQSSGAQHSYSYPPVSAAASASVSTGGKLQWLSVFVK